MDIFPNGIQPLSSDSVRQRRLAEVRRGVNNYKRIEELATRHWQKQEVRFPCVGNRRPPQKILKPIDFKTPILQSEANGVTSTFCKARIQGENISETTNIRQKNTTNTLLEGRRNFKQTKCNDSSKEKEKMTQGIIELKNEAIYMRRKSFSVGGLPKLSLVTYKGVTIAKTQKKVSTTHFPGSTNKKRVVSRHLNFYHALKAKTTQKRSWKIEHGVPKALLYYNPKINTRTGNISLKPLPAVSKQSKKEVSEAQFVLTCKLSDPDEGQQYYNLTLKDATFVVMTKVENFLKPIEGTTDIDFGSSVRECNLVEDPNFADLDELDNNQKETGVATTATVVPFILVDESMVDCLPRNSVDFMRKCQHWLDSIPSDTMFVW